MRFITLAEVGEIYIFMFGSYCFLVCFVCLFAFLGGHNFPTN